MVERGWHCNEEWIYSQLTAFVSLFAFIQIEEIEALSSIYGDEWCVIDEASRIFCIKIFSDLEKPKLTACLQVEEM